MAGEEMTEIAYTITFPESGEEATITVLEPTPVDSIQIVQHACGQCNKVYKGLRCLSKHLQICGKPKTPTKKGTKRKSSEETSPVTDDAEVAATSERSPNPEIIYVVGTGAEDKEKEEEEEEEEEYKLIDVIPHNDEVDVLSEQEDNGNDGDDKLCFCCEEPLKTAHAGHVKCKFCRKLFHTYMGRDKHTINLHNSSEKFPCSKCSCRAANAAILEQHVSKHTEFVCSICGMEFQRRYHLDRHTMNSKCGGSSVEKQPHTCDVCGKTFLRLDNLRVHLMGHLGGGSKKREHACTICDKKFMGHSMLLIHIRTHTGDRPFPCDLCDKAFPSNGALRKHRRVHTGEKPFECSFCHVKFAAKETLNRHMKTHTGNKPYKCNQCGVAFIQRTQLKNHMFHHTGDFGIPCPHCDEKFDCKPTLTRHLVSKHKVSWKCNLCSVVCGTKEDLEMHKTTMHSKNRRFICEDCCLEFPKKSLLLEHILTCGAGASAAQPVLKCRVCDKEYKRHDLLVRHESSAHLPGEEEKLNAEPRKRGRPKKLVVPSGDEIFNQLRDNWDASSFAENCPLKMSTVNYKTKKALHTVLEKIMTGLLNEEMLAKVGWPAKGVEETLQQLLEILGVQVDDVEEKDVQIKLKNQMMSLLEYFIGQEQMESMSNNYTVDQIMHYLSESVSK